MQVTGDTTTTRWRVDIDAEGHEMVSDEPASLGGANAGPSPFALVLAGLAACTGTTLQMYADRKGWRPIAVRVELELHANKEERRIRRQVRVSGAPDAAGMERLRDIVERTPVTLALKPGFEIETTLTEAPSAADANLDEALEESFPASDPISPA
jgi:putative redox protein